MNHDIENHFDLKAFLLNTDEGPQVMAEEYLLFAVSEMISEKMKKHGVSRAELARRLNKKPSQITAILRGTQNVTLRTLAAIAYALDLKVEMKMIPNECRHYAYLDEPVRITPPDKIISVPFSNESNDGNWSEPQRIVDKEIFGTCYG